MPIYDVNVTLSVEMSIYVHEEDFLDEEDLENSFHNINSYGIDFDDPHISVQNINIQHIPMVLVEG